MQKPSSAARSEFIVGGKYKLLRKIGSGSFGDIYQGINITNCEVRMCNIRGRISILKLLFKCTPPAITFIHLTFIGFLKNSRVLIKFLEKHLTARDQEPLILGKRAIFVREP